MATVGREELARYIQKEFGSIDVLVNNAALGYDEPDKIPAKELAQSYIGCNFLATVALTELLLPLLAADGKIINVSSKLGALVHHSEVMRW